jgi:hypothetical protein
VRGGRPAWVGTFNLETVRYVYECTLYNSFVLYAGGRPSRTWVERNEMNCTQAPVAQPMARMRSTLICGTSFFLMYNIT